MNQLKTKTYNPVMKKRIRKKLHVGEFKQTGNVRHFHHVCRIVNSMRSQLS